METLTVKIDNKKDLKLVTDFLKKIGLSFEREKVKKSEYNPEFVKQALEARQQIKEGKYHEKTLDTLWD